MEVVFSLIENMEMMKEHITYFCPDCGKMIPELDGTVIGQILFQCPECCDAIVDVNEKFKENEEIE